jgi:hypothetical protein
MEEFKRRTKLFAIQIIRLVAALPQTTIALVIGRTSKSWDFGGRKLSRSVPGQISRGFYRKDENRRRGVR